MAEATHDLRSMPREEAYEILRAQLDSVLAGIDDRIAAMATTAALIHHGFGHLWTGFYQVAEPGRLLRVGPYQGTLGCLEIRFGQGVCGTAVAEKKNQNVGDVSQVENYLACSPKTKSELVVLIRAGDEIFGQIDIDSKVNDAFSRQDQEAIEMVADKLSEVFMAERR